MSTYELPLTDANFDSEIANGVVLVDFWAPRCPPCRRLGPIISKVAAAMHGKAKVGKCNVDEWPRLAERYGIKGIPALVFLRDGQETERLNGFQEERLLLEKLTTAAQSNPMNAGDPYSR
jgi:thioredoxin 1